jgi:hypothetical protein
MCRYVAQVPILTCLVSHAATPGYSNFEQFKIWGPRMAKGFKKAQWEEWDKQGRPEGTFKYRGKTVPSPLPGMFDGVTLSGRGVRTLTPAELAKQKEKIEAQQAKAETELKALQTRALSLWKKDESCAKELGTVLLKIKALLPHGEFTKWWTAEGLAQARVSYCMRVAAPEGDKTKAARQQAKESPRAKTLAMFNKKVAQLYDVSAKGDADKALDLFQRIVEELKERYEALLAKPKAAAASAGH